MNHLPDLLLGSNAVSHKIPSMSAVALDDPRVIRAVEEYLAALEAGPGLDRQEFLARQPEIAEALAKCLDGLEFVHGVAPQLSQECRGQLASPAAEIQPEGPLGDFRILREIGRGGMGVVYEAVQVSLGRPVALKVLPFAAALDAKQLQRFKNEAQAAAHLHHQNIVPVYYVGCERGIHFYAMQYIEGQTLAKLIADLRLQIADLPKEPDSRDEPLAQPATPDGPPPPVPPSQICNLQSAIPLSTTPLAAALSTEPSTQSAAFFRTVANLTLQAAEALEHAHQLGVMHRDIKPANLMVDGRGHLWVTDFGLARLAGDAGLTMTGDLLGTLRYMSPEQALAKRAAVDHRTDIYSLGGTLYELLTLEPAYNGRSRAEVLRQIAFEEPRPPRRLNQAVPVELETIVCKAMEKNPAERYATAQELAEDLRRYLEDRPIKAKRPTLLQRLKKWMRRHKAVVLTAAVAAVVLGLMALVALAVAYAYVSVEKNQKEAALQEKDEALRQRDANLELARKAVDEIYQQLADKLTQLPHLQPLEREFLQTGLNFYQRLAQQKSTEPNIRLGTGSALRRVGMIHYRLGLHQQAEEAYAQAIALLGRLVAEYPAESQYRVELARAYGEMGWMLIETKGSQQAEQAHRHAITLVAQLIEECPDVPDYRKGLASSYNNLGSLLHARPPEAEALHHAAIKLCEQLVAQFPESLPYRGELVRSHYFLGLVYAALDRPLQAEKTFREAVALYQQAGDSLNAGYYRVLLPVAYFELAKVLNAIERPPEAEKAYRQAIVLLVKYVTDFPNEPAYWENLFLCYAKLVPLLEDSGRPEETTNIHGQALDLYAKLIAELPDEAARDPLVIRIAKHLATVLKNSCRPQEVARGYALALELADKRAAQFPTQPGYRFLAAYWHWSLGCLLAATGRAAEAENAFRRAATSYHAALHLNPIHVASLQNLAWLLSTCPRSSLRDAGQAVELAKKATELVPQAGHVWNALGVAQYRAGDWQAAIASLEKSLELDAGIPEWWAQRESYSTFFLAMAHWQQGDKQKARQFYDRAVRWMEKHQPKDEELHRFRTEAAALLDIAEEGVRKLP